MDDTLEAAGVSCMGQLARLRDGQISVSEIFPKLCPEQAVWGYFRSRAIQQSDPC